MYYLILKPCAFFSYQLDDDKISKNTFENQIHDLIPYSFNIRLKIHDWHELHIGTRVGSFKSRFYLAIFRFISTNRKNNSFE